MVITGGSDGMGRAVATNLAGRGAHVVVVARTTSKLQSTVEEMRVSALTLCPISFPFTHNLSSVRL